MMLGLDWKLLRAADVRGATPLRYAKKGHWAGWCAFLDRVKDQLWPFLPPGAREVGEEDEEEEAGEAGARGGGGAAGGW